MHRQRKEEHLSICLNEDVNVAGVSTGFERYRLLHRALPGIDLEEVDTSLCFLGRRLQAPLLISAMTGGTPKAAAINSRLAEAAQDCGIGLALGSQRAAVEDKRLASSYQVRHLAPDVLLVANLGAVQLNYGYGLAECRQVVDMIEADVLALHLNPLQEALQPHGDTRFSQLLPRIEAVCRGLDVPVLVKEVGWGISDVVARQLADAGVDAIEVAGAGGTSWSQVEMHRAQTAHHRALAAAFADWGIPTADSLVMVRRALPDLPTVASGGIRDGIEMAKALALGATVCGVARPFLQAADDSTAATVALVRVLVDQLRTAMFAVGAADLGMLPHVPVSCRTMVSASPPKYAPGNAGSTDP